MYAWSGPVDFGRQWSIVRPGTPAWVVAVTTSQLTRKTIGWQLLGGLAVCAPFAAGGALCALGGAAIALGVGVAASPLAVVAWFRRRHGEDVVHLPGGRFRGVTIAGAGMTMLKDLRGRFDYAHRLVDEVPTGIEWTEVERDVAELLWDAVDHAARVSACDAELRDLQYAAEGTPQATLKHAIEARRGEHWQVLLGHQREADELAREAGNAAAAAKVALARTGSVYSLEMVAPGRRALAARASLAEARARLALLTDVWSELDETGELQADRLGINAAIEHATETAPGGRRRRSRHG